MKFARQDALEVVEAIEVHDGYVACFAPQTPGNLHDAELELERYAHGRGKCSRDGPFLARRALLSNTLAKPPPDAVVLLTNGRGGMARLRRRPRNPSSRNMTALLAANLHPDFPVDRHVLAKRLRAWIYADGFITPLNLQNLARLEIGPPAVWNFVAEAGDGRTVELRMTANMLDGSNTTVLTFARQPGTPARRPAAAVRGAPDRARGYRRPEFPL